MSTVVCKSLLPVGVAQCEKYCLLFPCIWLCLNIRMKVMYSHVFAVCVQHAVTMHAKNSVNVDVCED